MIRRWPCIVVTILCCLTALLLRADPAFAISGNDWLRLSNTERGSYVAGVVDTWGYAKGLIPIAKEADPTYRPGKIEGAFAKSQDCVGGMSYLQILAIVEKYAKDHPETWHLPMATIIGSAIQATCPQ